MLVWEKIRLGKRDTHRLKKREPFLWTGCLVSDSGTEPDIGENGQAFEVIFAFVLLVAWRMTA